MGEIWRKPYVTSRGFGTQHVRFDHGEASG
jgi:hypothetical protein